MIEEKSWLTPKDRLRLAQVREQLKKGENPYSQVSKLTLGDAKEKLAPALLPSKERRKRTSATIEARRTKFARTRGKHVVIVPCDPADIPQYDALTPTCDLCKSTLDYVTSTMGKVLERFQRREEVYDRLYQKPNGKLFIVQSVDQGSVPVYKTVRVCPQCKPNLTEILDDTFDTVEVITKTGSTRRVRATSELEDGPARASRSGKWKKWGVL